jgi:hypothetical protein
MPLLYRLTQAVTITVAGVAACVLLGWALDIATLKSVLPGLVEMKVNTAVGFMLSAAGLALANAGRKPPWAKRLGKVLAAVIVCAGAITLVEYCTGRNLQVDQALFPDPSSSFPGRMAPLTAFDFVLVGVSFLLLEVPGRMARRLTLSLVFIAVASSTLALAGHLYQVSYFFMVTKRTGMALHTCVLFVLLGAGIFMRRTDGSLLEIMLSKDSGGLMLRRLLPAVYFLPLSLGLLVVQGQRLGFYSVQERACILVTLQIVLLFCVVRACGTLLHKLDLQRLEANQKRELLLTELQTALQEVKALSGLLPICAHCKHVRDDQGYWQRIETYIQDHSEATFTHGICDACLQKHYPEVARGI